MRYIISEKAKEVGEVVTMLAQRSSQKWGRGVRTQQVHCPREIWDWASIISRDILISTYLGGTITIATTSEVMYIWATDELPIGEYFLTTHPAVTKLFVMEKPPEVKDGQHRTSMQ